MTTPRHMDQFTPTFNIRRNSSETPITYERRQALSAQGAPQLHTNVSIGTDTDLPTPTCDYYTSTTTMVLILVQVLVMVLVPLLILHFMVINVLWPLPPTKFIPNDESYCYLFHTAVRMPIIPFLIWACPQSVRAHLSALWGGRKLPKFY